MTATDGQLQWVTNSKAAHRSAPGADDLEIFEITYNIACEYIARGEYEQARQLLRRAKGMPHIIFIFAV